MYEDGQAQQAVVDQEIFMAPVVDNIWIILLPLLDLQFLL